MKSIAAAMACTPEASPYTGSGRPLLSTVETVPSARYSWIPSKAHATAHRTCVHEPYGDALHCGGQGTFYCDRDKTVLDGIVAKLTRVVSFPSTVWNQWS